MLCLLLVCFCIGGVGEVGNVGRCLVCFVWWCCY